MPWKLRHDWSETDYHVLADCLLRDVPISEIGPILPDCRRTSKQVKEHLYKQCAIIDKYMASRRLCEVHIDTHVLYDLLYLLRGSYAYASENPLQAPIYMDFLFLRHISAALYCPKTRILYVVYYMKLVYGCSTRRLAETLETQLRKYCRGPQIASDCPY